jgi:hypothetical protein
MKPMRRRRWRRFGTKVRFRTKVTACALRFSEFRQQLTWCMLQSYRVSKDPQVVKTLIFSDRSLTAVYLGNHIHNGCAVSFNPAFMTLACGNSLRTDGKRDIQMHGDGSSSKGFCY